MSNVAQLPTNGKSDHLQAVYDRLIIRMEHAQSIMKLIAAVTDSESGSVNRPEGKHVRNAAHVADQMLSESINDMSFVYCEGA